MGQARIECRLKGHLWEKGQSTTPTLVHQSLAHCQHPGLILRLLSLTRGVDSFGSTTFNPTDKLRYYYRCTTCHRYHSLVSARSIERLKGTYNRVRLEGLNLPINAWRHILYSIINCVGFCHTRLAGRCKSAPRRCCGASSEVSSSSTDFPSQLL